MSSNEETHSDTIKDIASLKKDIAYLTKMVESGFSGVHARQDVANGKLYKHEEKLTRVDGELNFIKASFLQKEEYEKREGAVQHSNTESRYRDKLASANRNIGWLWAVVAIVISATISIIITKII
jgi:hypothetical protein